MQRFFLTCDSSGTEPCNYKNSQKLYSNNMKKLPKLDFRGHFDNFGVKLKHTSKKTAFNPP